MRKLAKHLPTIVQAAGTSIVAVSIALVNIPAGLGFAGVSLVVFGIAAERPAKGN